MSTDYENYDEVIIPLRRPKPKRICYDLSVQFSPDGFDITAIPFGGNFKFASCLMCKQYIFCESKGYDNGVLVYNVKPPAILELCDRCKWDLKKPRIEYTPLGLFEPSNNDVSFYQPEKIKEEKIERILDESECESDESDYESDYDSDDESD